MEQYGKIKHKNPNIMYIIRGIPGSGKSELALTLASNYHNDRFGVVCEADKFMVDAYGNYKFDKDKLKEAHRQCFLKALDAACWGANNIIISNLNIDGWEYTKYLHLAFIFDMNIQVITLDSTFNSINTSDDNVIKTMLKRWDNAANPRDVFTVAACNLRWSDTKEGKWEDLCRLCADNNVDLNSDSVYSSLLTPTGEVVTCITYKETFDRTYDKYFKQANTTTESEQS